LQSHGKDSENEIFDPNTLSEEHYLETYMEDQIKQLSWFKEELSEFLIKKYYQFDPETCEILKENMKRIYPDIAEDKIKSFSYFQKLQLQVLSIIKLRFPEFKDLI
jgi:ribosomal protein S12 methylthiotransferase accessory factor YcaO